MRHQITKKHPRSLLLSQATTIEAGISDHDLLISGDILFFNMMMQGRYNSAKHRFNNGFGYEEDCKQYQARIKLCVRLLAEALALNPHVYAIGLAEAPIAPADIALFIDEATTYPSLRPFIAMLKAGFFSPMGIVTLVNTNRFSVEQVIAIESAHPSSIKDRLSHYVLTDVKTGEKHRLFNMHLPYDIAKSTDPSALIRFIQQLFSDRSLPILAMGDFNILPTKVADCVGAHVCLQEDNNILLRVDADKRFVSRRHDTVDGVIRSEAKTSLRQYLDASALLFFSSNPFRELRLLRKMLEDKVASMKKTALRTTPRLLLT